MPSKKLTNANKAALLTDWFNSPANRGDIFYYVLAEVSATELQQFAFQKGLLISLTPVDNFSGKITFVDVLT